VGVVVGAFPAVLLEIGLGSTSGAVRLAIGVLLLQAAHAFLLRRVVSANSLVVGPAVIVITLVLGFEVYGVGGAYYGVALAIFGVAALDGVGRAAATRSPAA
jgi:predicted PurR-regulated permease PerM